MGEPGVAFAQEQQQMETIQIGHQDEQKKTQMTFDLPPQLMEGNVAIQKTDSLEKTNEQISQNMTQVQTGLLVQAVSTSAYDSRKDAALRLEKASKWYGDSSRMKQIKKDMKRLNAYLSLELPKDEVQFQKALAERCSMYRQLHQQCLNYMEARKNAQYEPGKTRLKLISEIAGYLQEEVVRFEDSAQQLFGQRLQTAEKATWTDALKQARTMSIGEVPANHEFIKESELTDEQKQAEKNKVAASRLAKLFGVSRLFEETTRVQVAQVGKEETGYLRPVQGMTLDRLEKLVQEERDQNPGSYQKICYPKAITRDLLQIRAIDLLFRFDRNPSDLSVEYEVREENGKKQWVITSVKAINNKNFPLPDPATKEEDKKINRLILLDRQMACRYLNISEEILKGALLDLYDSEDLQQIGQNCQEMQTRIKHKRSEFFDEKKYDEDIAHVVSIACSSLDINSDIAAYKELGKKEEEKDHTVQLGGLNRLVVQDFEGFGRVKEELLPFAQNDHKDWSEAGQQVMQAAKNYYEAYDQRSSQSVQYHQFANMIQHLRMWQNTQKQTEEEEQVCQTYVEKFKELFHLQDPQQEAELPESVNQFDEDMLTVAQAVYAHELETNKSLSEEQKADRELALKDLSGVPLFMHPPHILDIQQGNVGNCYFISALSSLVKRDPNIIMNMMTDNGATVTVKFPGHKAVEISKKIVVRRSKKKVAAYKAEKKSEDDIPFVEYYGGGSLWVPILEKAYVVSGARFAERQDKDESGMNFSKEEQKKIHHIMEKTGCPEYKARELFKNSIEYTEGGDDSLAIKQISEFSSRNVTFMRMRTVDDTVGVYGDLWSKVKKNEKEVPGLSAGQWMQVKDLMRKRMKKRLREELRFRYQTVYEMEGKGADNAIRASYRALTIEDIQDTLKDFRNWSTADGSYGYEDLMVELNEQFPDLKLTEEGLDEYLELLAAEFSEVNDAQQSQMLEHRGMLGTSGKITYTKRAVDLYEKIRTALEKGSIVSATANKFSPDEAVKGAGLNGEKVVNGIAGDHGYAIMGCRKGTTGSDEGKYFLTLNNPWGKGMIYEQRRDVNGKEYYRGKENESQDTRGSFELELNDFLQYFSDFTINAKK